MSEFKNVVIDRRLEFEGKNVSIDVKHIFLPIFTKCICNYCGRKIEFGERAVEVKLIKVKKIHACRECVKFVETKIVEKTEFELIK